jgi:hypothetical protein
MERVYAIGLIGWWEKYWERDNIYSHDSVQSNHDHNNPISFRV